jgi:phosphate transport system ATP-binding protein
MNKFILENLSLTYSDNVQALKEVDLEIPANSITVLFGPAGGGKSSLLRTLNRLNDLADVRQITGRADLLDHEGNILNLLDKNTDVIALRRRLSMVLRNRACRSAKISPTAGGQWCAQHERLINPLSIACNKPHFGMVKDRLDEPATMLSGATAAPVPGVAWR